MSHWKQVETIFLEALDLPPHDRDRFLRHCCSGDPEMLADVMSLLAADVESEALIDAAVQDVAASLFDTQNLIGKRLGLYRIDREIGRGGMGSVYLAFRDDSEYQKNVAIKIVRRGMDTADVLERFRHERQILANLEHPYIARLFDGGSTNDGVPFFVMEYIEGKPLDRFCRDNALDCNARCELFLRILEAVAYAHRGLVVHRDLKPANILVMPDGTPKLLDFGVAKLLGGDLGDDRTRTGALRTFTPAYASPEQVRGVPITTATDIYSLGAILYELLVGIRAQQIDIHTPAEIEKVVCQTEIARPSLQKQELHSDLDNIILMATRKEPERRYLSAIQFGEDIRRYLDGKPVIARQSSLRYRTTKFILRNRLQVAAAVLIAASLIVGFGSSLRQTHRANLARATAEAQRLLAEHQSSLAKEASVSEAQQRAAAEQQRVVAEQQRVVAGEQRDRAEQQKTIADQRSRDMMDLAGRTLFEIHDAIATLPGSVAARQTLVNTTLAYLENLQRQAGLDDEMRLALSAAYFKVAMIQGDPQGASLQQFDLAEKSLLRGQALLMPAYDRRSNELAFMMRLVQIRGALADLMFRTGRAEQSARSNIDLLPLADRLFLKSDCALECRMQEAGIENNLTYELLSSDPSRALQHAKRGIQLDRELLKQYPNVVMLRQRLGAIMAGEAAAYRSLGDLESARKDYLESIAIREELLRGDPTSVSLRRGLMIVYGNFATLLGIGWSPNLNEPAEARIYAGKCVALARQAVAGDASDVTARHDLGMSLSRLGMIDPGPDGVAQSLASLEEAQALIEPIVKVNPKAAETANQIGTILEYEGHRLEALGRNAEALARYQESLRILQPFFDGQNASVLTQYFADEQYIAFLEASTGDTTAALDMAKRALTQAMKISGDSLERTETQKVVLARAWSILGITQSRLGTRIEAGESATNAMKLWETIQKPVFLLPNRALISDTKALVTAGREE